MTEISEFSINEVVNFQFIFDHLPIGITITKINGKSLVNKAFSEMLGYTSEELSFINWRDFTHPEDIDLTEESARILLLPESKSRILKKRYLHKNGEVVYAELYSIILQDEENNPAYIFSTIADVNSHKILENKLLYSESLYRTLFEKAGDFYFLFEFQGEELIIIDVNLAGLKAHGYTKEELIGQPVTRIDPFQNEESKSEINEKIKQDGSVFFIAKHIRKDGSTLLVEVNAQLIIFGNKKFLLTVERDITERDKYQESIRESEEKFRNAFDYNCFGMAIIGLDGKFTKVNKALCDILGYTEEEFLQLKTIDVVPKYSLKDTIERGESILNNTITHLVTEQQYKKKDNSLINGRVVVSLVRSSQQQPLFFIVQIEDITEIKNAENLIKENKARFSALFEHASDGIFMSDLDGNYNLVNTAACEMLGYSKEELLKMKISDLLFKEEIDPYPNATKDILEWKTTRTERKLIKKDGNLLEVEISAKRIDEHTLQGIVRDISARNKTLKEIKEKVEELEKFNNLTIDRELRMIELKKEINTLLIEAGKEEKYKIAE